MKSVLSFIIISCLTVYAQDTVSTASGLKYVVVQKGSGEKAENGKAVEVDYTGSLLNGKVFDSSRDRGEPIEFVLGEGQVIKGWDEGIALMRVGDRYTLIIPSDLAYGEQGSGDVIPPNSTLVFDVELMSVSVAKTPIADVLLQDVVFKGVDSAVVKYHELKQNEPDQYNFKESQLNILGYQLLQAGRTNDAIVIFILNCSEFPKSFNVYDSLGEAYLVSGNKDLAVENYKKSLDINPKNKYAKQQLDKLNSK